LSYSRVCSMTRIDAYEDFIHSSNGVMYLRNLTRRWLRVRRRLDRERRRCRRSCGCGGHCALAVARLGAFDQIGNVYREETPLVFPQSHRTHFNRNVIVPRGVLRPEHSVILCIAGGFLCLVILRPARNPDHNWREHQPF